MAMSKGSKVARVFENRLVLLLAKDLNHHWFINEQSKKENDLVLQHSTRQI